MTVANGAFTRTQAFGQNTHDTCRPLFYTEAVQSGEVDGRPTYREVERVKIIMPGNGLNMPVFNVSDEHRERWPAEYEAFKKGLEPALNGTPLEEWAILNKAQVMELKAMHIRTIEDVAGLADTAIQRIGRGGYVLRERAQAYLDQAKEQELVTRVTAENEALKERTDVLERQVEEMGVLLEQLNSRLLASGDQPNHVATTVPASQDVNERRKPVEAQGAPQQSSFDTMAPAKKRPGRPKKT